MDALIPIALILLGLGLVAVEVYLVPGVSVVGVLGVLSVATGVVAAFLLGGVAGGAGAVVGTAAAGGALLWWMWDSGAWDRFILHDQLGPGADAVGTTRAGLLGKTGVALSPLRPTGVAEIEGPDGPQRIEVQTEGAFVAAGSRVRIVAMDRRRFLVRLADDEPVADAR